MPATALGDFVEQFPARAAVTRSRPFDDVNLADEDLRVYSSIVSARVARRKPADRPDSAGTPAPHHRSRPCPAAAPARSSRTYDSQVPAAPVPSSCVRPPAAPTAAADRHCRPAWSRDIEQRRRCGDRHRLMNVDGAICMFTIAAWPSRSFTLVRSTLAKPGSGTEPEHEPSTEQPEA